MTTTSPKQLPRALTENLDRNVCVCYDVPKQQIIDAYLAGSKTFMEISTKTYACQGSACCEAQVKNLVKLLNEAYPNG